MAFVDRLYAIYGGPWTWESLVSNTPYQGFDVRNPVTEGMGCQVYVYLAQLMETLSEYVDTPTDLTSDDLSMSVQILGFTMNWLDYSGFRHRHPDLGVLPNEVAPTEFQGGPDHTKAWISGQLSLLTGGEKSREQSKLN